MVARSLRRFFPPAGWIALVVASVSLSAQITGPDFFEKNIRPLFIAKCYGCHASATPMGGLRLDSREAILKGGGRGPAIVDGKPNESVLIRAVRQTSDDLKMPPGGKLSDAEVALLAQWVAMGAPWSSEPAKASNASAPAEKFWAFVPPKDPKLPAVKDSAWVKSPIDAFVLAGLEAKNLKPAPAATKRELIRRATFDLIGLPPTPEEVKAFLADDRPDAFARVVDRLLASPRYGERWGRHWLDVARYADSNGLDENLVYRNAWRYRDYVINAFNKDKPYDEFVREQLAGDLMTKGQDLATTFERWTATGFLSLGAKMLAEDDPVKMQMDIVDEQLDTTSRAFMGLTVGCARCHDHKFDPIPQADYYSLAGIFKSSKTMENFKVVATWHEYVLAPEEDRERLTAIIEKIKAKNKEAGALIREEDHKLAEVARRKLGAYLLAASDLLRYEQMTVAPVLSGGKTAPQGAVLREAASFDRGNVPKKFEKGKPNTVEGQKGPWFAEYDVTVPAAGVYELDMLEEETGGGTADVAVNGVVLKNGAAPVENRAASPDAGGWSVTGFFPLKAGHNVVRLEHKSRFPYFEKLLLTPNPLPKDSAVPLSTLQIARQYSINPGYLDHWAEELQRAKGAPHSELFAWFAFQADHRLDAQNLSAWTSPAAKLFEGFHPKTAEELAARYEQLADEADRQWHAYEAAHPPDKPVDDEAEDLAPKAAPKQILADGGLDALREMLYAKAGPFRAPDDSRQYFPAEARAQLEAIEKGRQELEKSKPDYPRAMGVMEGSKPADIAIHLRGSHWTLGRVVPRGFLHVIAGDNQTPIPAGESGRLEFAEWLTTPNHPLTSRVMANRIWRWHFGRGIVPSVDNFGRLGERPTNQPLLDWLAVRFVEHGWSIKELHRLIMLSNTYRMSARYDEHSAEVDPENKLMWRANRQRLEVEEIRDAIMAVSGDFDLAMGGSMLSYRDRQYVSDTEKRGSVDYDRNRRAVYMPVVRSSLYEVFQAFDLPDTATSTGDRAATVVAPQALFMMNGTVVLKHTHEMADQLLKRQDLDDAGRIRDAYERALSRPPSPGEIDRALSFIAQIDRAMLARKPDDAERRLFAWQSFCKALLSSNEFIYLN